MRLPCDVRDVLVEGMRRRGRGLGFSEDEPSQSFPWSARILENRPAHREDRSPDWDGEEDRPDCMVPHDSGKAEARAA